MKDHWNSWYLLRIGCHLKNCCSFLGINHFRIRFHPFPCLTCFGVPRALEGHWFRLGLFRVLVILSSCRRWSRSACTFARRNAPGSFHSLCLQSRSFIGRFNYITELERDAIPSKDWYISKVHAQYFAGSSVQSCYGFMQIGLILSCY